ncbi:hamartin-like [Haliotis rubra]|uniref:hamartin-like n=1 Tax=Haliotis rubra TaxID=36100 RepID=UPI001EE50F9D|nr:hamartin-like [Haliotis rubra]
MAASIQIDQPQNINAMFTLLESSDIDVADDIRRLILDNLTSGREAWLIHTLVDYYYVTHSVRIEEILAEVREPQDKPLLDKLQDGLKNKEKLQSLQLLMYIVYKQPPWTHKIVASPIFSTLLKCLKNANDIPVVMTALMIVTMLLPVVPVTIGSHLQEIFDIFMRLSTFSIKKPANTPDIFLLHLQVALYSMLHRLYGMYPSSFLTYLHQQYRKKDNAAVFDEVIMPMLERVRLHPFLIVGSREQETSTNRWKRMETQDVVVECTKMSLDHLEGTWEQLRCPIFAHSYQAARDLVTQAQEHPQGQDASSSQGKSYDSIVEFLSVPNPDVYLKYSPSVLIGLSTPPQSQRNTPATSFLDISSSSMPHSLLGTYGNTPMHTPIDTTPRETPTMAEDADRALSRNSTRSLLHKSDPKRQSFGSTSSRGPSNLPDLKITPGSQPSSVPPSPLKPEFTSEPPKGAVKTMPVRRAIRELRFDRIPELQCDQRVPSDGSSSVADGGSRSGLDGGSRTVHDGSRPVHDGSKTVHDGSRTVHDGSRTVHDGSRTVHHGSKTVHDGSRTVHDGSRTVHDGSRTVHDGGLQVSVASAKGGTNVIDGLKRCDSAVEAVTIDELHHVMQELGEDEDGECDDPEMVAINQETDTTKSESSDSYDEASSSCQHLTAESVKQFMTKVNRIRFNSLSNNGNGEQTFEKRGVVRSSSCPMFKQENGVIEENEPASRCASTSFQSHSNTTIDKLPIDNVEPPPHEPESGVKPDVPKCEERDVPTVPEKEPVEKQLPLVLQEDGNTFNIMKVFQTLMSPVSVVMCQNCRNQLLVPDRKPSDDKTKHQGCEIPLFSSVSPVELLERHLKMGSELHAKELTRIPLTSKDTVHWTHFGGAPPADEVNILRGQVLMLGNQVQYERHKRDLHAKRNRRLLRKIANATALEEQNKAKTEQLRLLEEKIHNMQVSLRLLQDENQEMRQAKESNEYEKLVQFRVTMQANSDFEMSNTELKSLLITQREDHDKLKKALQETEHRLFDKEKQLEMMTEAVSRTNKLKEHVFTQQKEILLLGELQHKYQEKIDLLKRQQHTHPQHDHVVMAMKAEVKSLKSQLSRQTVLLDTSQRKLSECEETLKDKEIALGEMKTKLEAVKAIHGNELKAVEEKYRLSMRINQEYEGKVLDMFTLTDQLNQQLRILRQAKASRRAPRNQTEDQSTISRARSVPPDSDKSASVTECVGGQCESPKQQDSSDTCSAMASETAAQGTSKLAEDAKFEDGKHLSKSFDSMSITSQDGASPLGYDAKTKSTDSEDIQSLSSRSTRTMDSGVWEKSTK